MIEVLANGNLLVSGEKQVGINQGSEFIRFSGVVNPTTILYGNTRVLGAGGGRSSRVPRQRLSWTKRR